KVDRTAQRSRREAYRAIGDQRGSLARIDGVALHVDEQVKVAAGRAADSGLAFAGHPNAGAFIDAGGNFDRKLALGHCPAFAMTIGARIADHFARSAARGATAFDHEESLLRPHFPHSAAGLAGVRAMFSVGAAAAVARLAAGERL